MNEWLSWPVALHNIFHTQVCNMPLGTRHHRRFWHVTQDCVAPYVDHILHRYRFWAIPLIQAVWNCGISDPAVRCSAMWCGGVLEVSSSSLEERWQDPLGICVIVHTRNVPQKGQAIDWTIAIALSLGCLVSLQTSSFRTNWWHLKPSNIRRHHWSKASIFRASVLETAQQSDQIGA